MESRAFKIIDLDDVLKIANLSGAATFFKTDPTCIICIEPDQFKIFSYFLHL